MANVTLTEKEFNALPVHNSNVPAFGGMREWKTAHAGQWFRATVVNKRINWDLIIVKEPEIEKPEPPKEKEVVLENILVVCPQCHQPITRHCIFDEEMGWACHNPHCTVTTISDNEIAGFSIETPQLVRYGEKPKAFPVMKMPGFSELNKELETKEESFWNRLRRLWRR